MLDLVERVEAAHKLPDPGLAVPVLPIEGADEPIGNVIDLRHAALPAGDGVLRGPDDGAKALLRQAQSLAQKPKFVPWSGGRAC